MCGIVGFAGDSSNDLKKAFSQLLLVDQLRGDHSTGVLSVRNYDGNTRITKMVGGPENLLDSKRYNDQYTDFNKVMLGHNRFATSGKVTAANAHPFDFDTLVGVHNGSLRNYTELPDHNSFDVDSEALYNAIEQLGLDDALAKVTGAYALVWWNKVDQTLNFIRNNERTLYLAFTDNQKSIMWASEDWMLEGIAGRNNIKLQEIWMLKADTHVSINLSGSIRDKIKMDVRQDVKGGTEVAATSVVPFRQGSATNTTCAGGNNTTSTTNSGTGNSVQSTEPNKQTGSKATTTTQEAITTHESPVGRGTMYFTCGMKGCDDFGAKFVVLVRANDPRQYRLYLKREDYGKFNSGDSISGEVVSLKIEQGDKLVYKIGNSTVINLTTKQQMYVKKAEELAAERTKTLNEALSKVGEQIEDEKEVEILYPDHNGRHLSKEDFLKKHQFCSYCTTNIEPENGYRFIKDEILCDGCMEDKVLVDSLS